ncbi:MAG: lipase family protein, partial [Selenomonas sp.]
MKQMNCALQRFRAAILTILFFCLAFLPLSASAKEEPEFDLLAALVSSASYSDDGGLLVRGWLKETAWDFQSRSTSTRAAEGRVHLARKTLADGRRIAVLSFPGTENKKDIEVDLRLSAVPFGGTSPAEFAAVAAGSGSRDLPHVHKGFNDFVMAALFTEAMPEFGNRTAGEALAEELKENPKETLYLTGHSL